MRNILSMKRLLQSFVLIMSHLAIVQAAEASPKIQVQPEFRTTPIWYVEMPDSKCTPVPSYDVISRVGPKAAREANIPKKAGNCDIRLDDRKILATLYCEGKEIQTYFSKEALCEEHLNSVAKATSKTEKK